MCSEIMTVTNHSDCVEQSIANIYGFAVEIDVIVHPFLRRTRLVIDTVIAMWLNLTYENVVIRAVRCDKNGIYYFISKA